MKRLAKRGFTLIELLVVVGIIALLISILLPSLSKAREISRRTACGANMKSMATSCLVYSEANRGVFPSPATSTNTVSFSWIGNRRFYPDGSPTAVAAPPTVANNSNTRGYFKLLMGGTRAFMQPKQFICPSGRTLQHDPKGPEIEGVGPSGPSIVKAYDFDGRKRDSSLSEETTFSYSMQVTLKITTGGVTYGTAVTTTQDPRKAIAADRNPYSNDAANTGMADTEYRFNSTKSVFGLPAPPTASSLPPGMTTLNQGLRSKNANSRNHNREGQNVAYLDGHAAFQKVSKAGADEDCIWIAQTDAGGAAGIPTGDVDPATLVGAAYGKTLNMSKANWLTDSVLAP